MDTLAIHLALHGALVLLVSIVAGLLLYRAILQEDRVAAWHLVHSGGSGRGVMLLALAAVIHLLRLPAWQMTTVVWLTLFFVWTSMAAMIIAAASGERGLRFEGTTANRLVHVLYVVGTVAILPACVILIVGFLLAVAART